MTSLEQVQTLMTELGPSMPEIEAIAQKGDATWAVALPDEVVVVLEVDPTGRNLVAAIDVGSPAEDTKLSTYEAALNYAYLWRDTGGARLALGGPDGELTLLFDIDLSELTLAELRVVLEDLAGKAQVWRGFVASAGQTSSFEAVGIRI